MAVRPVFVCDLTNEYFKSIDVEFVYYPGFSVAQKQRCINSLHKSFVEQYDGKIIEISSKSSLDLGVKLSAFNLCDDKGVSVECKFQGSKVFEKGGPYTDILVMSSRDAKRDLRLRNSGLLRGFKYGRIEYPLEPKTAYYDWVYINTLWKYNRDLVTQIVEFDAFSDIEFNPKKSLNCQARALAIFVSLYRRNELKLALKSFKNFTAKIYKKI